MGGSVETSSSSSTSANPHVQPTVSKLMQGLQGQYDSGVKVFNKSLYPGVGTGTQNAWSRGASNANSLLAGGGFNAPQSGAMSTLGGVRSGYAGLSNAYAQDAPGYQTMRQNLMDDAVKNVGAGFNASGRFGGGSYIDSATESAVNAIAPLDYQNFQNNVNNQYRSLDSQAGIASSLFGMGQQGIANRAGAIGALGGIGASQDADALARRQAENDLHRRQNDAGWDTLSRASSILSGTAGAGGTNTSQQVPWWAMAAGLGSTLAGGFM